MLTILWWFIKIVAIIAIVLWFTDNPGSIAIEWLGWSIEGPIGLFVLVVAIISLALFVLQSLYWRLRQVPMRLREWRAAREHRRAVDTLSHALVALASDEGEAALQQSTQAIKALDHDAFARLVHAQALDAAGSYREAEQMYKALCEQEATRFLGLKGLALMNKRQANTDKAIEYLEQALILRPGSLWASEELLRFGRQGLLEFKRYTSLLQTAEKLELIDHDSAVRERVEVLCNQAQAALHKKDLPQAITLVKSALKLSHHDEQANCFYARLLADQGKIRKALRLIESVWRTNPGPELARIYREIGKDESGQNGRTMHGDIMKMERLASLLPGHPESRLIKAQIALDETQFDQARTILLDLVDLEATAIRACRMLAELEQKQNPGSNAAQQWLLKELQLNQQQGAPSMPVLDQLPVLDSRPAPHG